MVIAGDAASDREERLQQAIVEPGIPLSEALVALDRNGLGVLLVADSDRRLLGVITDGDIRRHILSGGSLDVPAGEIATRTPRTARPGTSTTELLHRMSEDSELSIEHLPLVDQYGTIVGLVLRRDLLSIEEPELSAVIMAGGLGTRLRPLTNNVPKPMLPVGDRPLMERTIERMRKAGIRNVSVTTHFCGDVIASHFGDGRAFGVELQYVAEDRPLGTAGALRLMSPPPGPLLVVNGDILTGLNYHDLLSYHREMGADATVGLRNYDVQVPYGVVDCSGNAVTGLREKPTQRFLVNAGVYLLDPGVLSYIPADQRFDMTDLIQRLLDAGKRVVGFPIVEYWLDIGQPADYERAQTDTLYARV